MESFEENKKHGNSFFEMTPVTILSILLTLQIGKNVEELIKIKLLQIIYVLKFELLKY